MDQSTIPPINHFLAKYDPHIITICTFLFSAFFPFFLFFETLLCRYFRIQCQCRGLCWERSSGKFGPIWWSDVRSNVGPPSLQSCPLGLHHGHHTSVSPRAGGAPHQGHSTTDTTPVSLPELVGHQLHISGLVAPRRDSDTFWR